MGNRLEEHARLGRNQRTKVGKAKLATIDFKHGRYEVLGGNATLESVCGDPEAFWYGGTFDETKVEAGIGLRNTAGWVEFSLTGALVDRFEKDGFTLVAELEMPNAAASGLYCDVYDAGAHTFNQGFKLDGSVFKHWETPPSGTQELSTAGPPVIGKNRLAFTASRNFSGLSVNGAASVMNVRPPAHQKLFDAVVIGVNSAGGRNIILTKLEVYQPCLDERMLRAFST